MAGVNTKDIKQRIRSMESTRQITRAMEMVASSKLRKAQERIQNSRPYFEILYKTISDIAAGDGDFSSPYITAQKSQRICCVLIAGDRGLAGGYNSNVFKMVLRELDGQDFCMLPIGKKAVDFCRDHGLPVLSDSYASAADVSIGDCFSIAKQLSKRYLAGEFGVLRIAYTNYVSVLSQNPAVLPLLPLSLTRREDEPRQNDFMLYEPDPEAVFDAVIPEYLGGVVYGALCESLASELAARRTAMDSATQNATDMIDQLNLQYNRARQGAITQEITEIVAGAEA